MMSSKQLWPVGPRNAKVAWKKRPSQTPKAKAAPCPGDDRPDAVPKAKSKADKNRKKPFILMTTDFMCLSWCMNCFTDWDA